jgi:hypothetical protein
MVVIKNPYNVFVEISEGKRQLGRPKRRWEIEWEFVDWMHLAQDRDQCQAVVKTVMNLRVL